MNNLKSKLKKQGGFTLIEMLIVVAIIAILIAIAIPMVNAALEKSREATDKANERAAYGLAYIAYMTNEPTSQGKTDTGIGTDGGTAYYVVTDNKGKLTPTFDKTNTYGKGTAAGDIKDNNVGKIIKIVITPATATGGTGGTATDENIELTWVDSGT